MSELRAPDPTLDAIEPDALIGLDYSEGDPLIGHSVQWVNREHVPECTDPSSDAYGPIETVGARHARWFAVPCRVCFPDAPPPGFRRVGHTNLGVAGRVPVSDEDPGLSWQVPS